MFYLFHFVIKKCEKIANKQNKYYFEIKSVMVREFQKLFSLFN